VHASHPVFNAVGEWMEENENYFLPPICNKMMHNTHLKVGGGTFLLKLKS
jgi:hypothetical protein